jgi:hypothetical protein
VGRGFRNANHMATLVGPRISLNWADRQLRNPANLG